MVIRLPGDKAIAVDAKVPLDAYLEASAIPLTALGPEGARRKALLDKHVKAVRAHVDALAKKAYWAGLSSSPEFVVCFVPSESLLAAALEEDPSLLDYAFGKRVALASPVNLWAVLKTVAYTWTQQDVSKEARALFELGNELYERLGKLAGHADDLRRAIERTVDSYNRFAGSLESRVLVTARRFPGIDQTKLDALGATAVVEKAPRRLTAPELLDATLDGEDGRLEAGDASAAALRRRCAPQRRPRRPARADRAAGLTSGQAPPGTKLRSAITAAETATKAPIIHHAEIWWSSSRRTRKRTSGRRAGSVAFATTAIAPVCGLGPLACADIVNPLGSENTRASPLTPVRLCQNRGRHHHDSVTSAPFGHSCNICPHARMPSAASAAGYSHFEVRCSDTMRRRVPERPRSTTLSL